MGYGQIRATQYMSKETRYATAKSAEARLTLSGPAGITESRSGDRTISRRSVQTSGQKGYRFVAGYGTFRLALL